MALHIIHRLADSIIKAANVGTSNDPVHRRAWAVVASIQAGPPKSLTLTIAGSSTLTAGIRYEDWYTPTVGDTVMCEWWGSDLVVFGKLA